MNIHFFVYCIADTHLRSVERKRVLLNVYLEAYHDQVLYLCGLFLSLRVLHSLKFNSVTFFFL